ncbi:MAG: hypothetical protein ACRDBY_11095 [Cetobacterium sp.]
MGNTTIYLKKAKEMDCYKFYRIKEELADVIAGLDFGYVGIKIHQEITEKANGLSFSIYVKNKNNQWRMIETLEKPVLNRYFENLDKTMFETLMDYLVGKEIYWNKPN